MNKIKRNIGFDNRIFLSEVEWNTYVRRKPVRYIKKKLQKHCAFCGLSPTSENSFQNAHIIGFDMGVIDLAMTPEYLDSDENITTAHKKICNKKSELNLHDAMIRLKQVYDIKYLPEFLPTWIHELWNNV